MNIIHKDLAAGRWFKFTLLEQLAHVGSDVERMISWRNKGDMQYSQQAFERVLELIDLTKADPKNKKRLKELCRVREFLADYFVGDNLYSFTDEYWQKYFYEFAYAAAIARGR
jgi:hypothetical protein